MRAWIDRRNYGLSGMPADGSSLPPRTDFGMSRWVGSKLRIHRPRDWAEAGMTARGTFPKWRDVSNSVAIRGKADIR